MDRLEYQEHRIGPVKRRVRVDAESGLLVSREHPLSAMIVNAAILTARFVTGTSSRKSKVEFGGIGALQQTALQQPGLQFLSGGKTPKSERRILSDSSTGTTTG